tara:strand:- start:271 stop:423 length:153 start_codon:yes stop_codon:yes gene_type:complete
MDNNILRDCLGMEKKWDEETNYALIVLIASIILGAMVTLLLAKYLKGHLR